jgi:MFS transporter, OFA family, oxalate/formate antiporter
MTRMARSRWGQLGLGLLCMVMIANYQYGWTLFVAPLDAKFGWGRAAIQWAFTIFVLLETWLIPVEGYLVDRYGPRIVVLGGGVLCGASWALSSVADALPMLYLSAALAGVGAGAVYGTCVGNAMKWFPDRRGLAGGLTSAGFGTGSALTLIPISTMIQSQGYAATFLVFGLVQGGIVFLAGLGLRAPKAQPEAQRAPEGPAPLPRGGQASTGSTSAGSTPAQMLRHPAFWLMYGIFVLVCTGGLVVVAQIAPIAKDFQVAAVPVHLMGLALPALTFALAMDRVMNGITRPLLGWLSDGIGRETVMFLAFALEGVGVLALVTWGRDPVAFVLLSGTVFLGWGQIFGLFPAACTDFFGERFAAANYGLLYTAKGMASILVPLANLLSDHMGSWTPAFWIIAGLDFAAALLAVGVLRPMRLRVQGKRRLPGTVG